MPDRPTQCASCNKRMSKKTWYYRNGQYFCKKRCYEEFKAKAAKEAQDKKEEAAPKDTKAEAKPAPAAEKAEKVEKAEEAKPQAAST